MSQLKQIRNQISSVSQANKLCNSMSILSTIKMNIFKNRLKTASKKMNLLGGIIYKINSNLFNQDMKKLTFNFFSDFGFCGEFNTHNLCDNNITLGKKSKNAEIQTGDFIQLSKYIENKINNNYNFEFIINDFHTCKPKSIHFLDFINSENEEIPRNTSFECSESDLKLAYFRMFMNYIFTFATFSENSYRSKIMKNAVENSKEILNNLVVNLNKTRQMSITNEILLIVSCGGES